MSHQQQDCDDSSGHTTTVQVGAPDSPRPLASTTPTSNPAPTSTTTLLSESVAPSDTTGLDSVDASSDAPVSSNVGLEKTSTPNTCAATDEPPNQSAESLDSRGANQTPSASQGNDRQTEFEQTGPYHERVDASKFPFLTSSLKGIGGQLKTHPTHFIVEEVPLYEPSGDGKVLLIDVVRQQANTRDVAQQLSKIFHLRPEEVGIAGLKDNNAVTMQTFSVPKNARNEDNTQVEVLTPESAVARIHAANGRADCPIKLQVKGVPVFNKKKLRRGQIKGNKFRILVVGLECPVEEAMTRTSAIASSINGTSGGFPNYFGVQRIGVNGRTACRGRSMLKEARDWRLENATQDRPANKKRKFQEIIARTKGSKTPWIREFNLNAFQSVLFNECLAKRIENGMFDHAHGGDSVVSIYGGKFFKRIDVDEKPTLLPNPRDSVSGPIFGGRMKLAKGKQGTIEQGVLDRYELTLDDFRVFKLEGSRRAFRVPLDCNGVEFSFCAVPSVKEYEVGVMEEFGLERSVGVNGGGVDVSADDPNANDEGGVLFTFSLPKGSYATSLLREFQKTEFQEAEENLE